MMKLNQYNCHTQLTHLKNILTNQLLITQASNYPHLKH